MGRKGRERDGRRKQVRYIGLLAKVVDRPLCMGIINGLLPYRGYAGD